MLIEIIFVYFSINNISQPTWQTILTDFLQFFFSSIIFLSFFIWSLVLFAREKKKNPSSRRYLPRILGFLFALLLSVVGLTFGLQWYIWS